MIQKPLETPITSPKPPRYIGAKVGIAVAVATIVLIVYRLADATTPVPTGVVLESQTMLSVESLQVDGHEALPKGWASPAPAASAASAARAATVQSSVGLRIGRPAAISATLSGTGAPTVSCVLEPRPHGECLIRANFVSATELRCSFECKSAPPKP